MKVFISTRPPLAICMTLALAGCTVMPASGPTARNVNSASSRAAENNASIRIIDVTGDVTRHLLASDHHLQFLRELGEGVPVGAIIGKGDVLDITVWEAPPAALFGASDVGTRYSVMGATGRGTALPEQMVDSDGRINIPFAGSIAAAGRTPQQVAREIDNRLVGKAHQPQAIVRLSRNATATVAVVGDVVSSARIPLTAKGERVLDVLAGAGGVKQPVNKTTIRITRGAKTVAMPLEGIIRDPKQNIILQSDDIITVMYQPYSFVALGAIGRNEEVPMEATGINLTQALARVAGLQDARADVKGVFLFRLETPGNVPPYEEDKVGLTADGKIPVIYRINMKDPATFFLAQNFQIRDKDVLYVSNAPLADFQKFVGVISSTVLPVVTTISVTK